MTLERSYPIGTLKINSAVISKVILKSISTTNGKAYLASEKGKLLGGLDKRISHGELVGQMDVEEKDGNLRLGIYIITEFGASISQVTDKIFDCLEAELKPLFPNQTRIITINIVGVKYKRIAKREIQIVRRYGAKR